MSNPFKKHCIMIDNVKMYILRKDDFENIISREGKVDLKTFKSLLTNQIELYPKKGKLGNLEIVINEKRGFINGSLHKLENILTDDENQNYDDFNYCQLKNTIFDLLNYFHIKDGTSVSQLELGLNLHFPINPKLFIDFNLLLHNFRDHNKNLKFRGKGDYKEFQSTDFHIKIYNKSKQNQIRANILRVEIKIIRKRLIQKLGVYKIEDLLMSEVLYNIFILLLNEIKKCTIIDKFETLNIPEKDLEKLYRYTNPNYWLTLKENKSNKVQLRLKKDFEIVANKYNLLKSKNMLLELMIEKFTELMNCPENLTNTFDLVA